MPSHKRSEREALARLLAFWFDLGSFQAHLPDGSATDETNNRLEAALCLFWRTQTTRLLTAG